jgi:hypothetical protein
LAALYRGAALLEVVDAAPQAHGHGDRFTAQALAKGTPLLARHAATGEWCRAEVVADHGDGTCRVQYAVSWLGAEPRKPKRELVSLRRGRDTLALWLRVSRALGRTASAQSAADAGGHLSHAALLAWLSAAAGVGWLDATDRAVLLADLDRRHCGLVAAAHFDRVLARRRARLEASGVEVYGPPGPPGGDARGDAGPLRSSLREEGKGRARSGKGETGTSEDLKEEDEELDTEDEADQVEKGQGVAGTDADDDDAYAAFSSASVMDGAAVAEAAANEARLEQLEVMMLSMAQREQSLALALAESTQQAAGLDAEVYRLRQLHPELGQAKPQCTNMLMSAQRGLGDCD